MATIDDGGSAASIVVAGDVTDDRGGDMHLIELWNTTDAWHALDTPKRQAFFERTVAAMASVQAGATCLGWGTVERAFDSAAPYPFVAVWEFESAADTAAFLRALRETGWYEYFEQVNAAAELMPPPAVVEQIIDADVRR